MPVPLAVALPGAAAGAAYLNARMSLWYDVHLVQCALPATLSALWRERTDRLSPFYVLERHAQNKSSADRAFIIFEGKSWTYAQVYENVLRYGAWLRERHGVKPKDIVAVDFQNSDVFIFIWFGLWSIGAKPAFMNYNLTGSALAHCIKTATTSLVLVDPLVASNVNQEVRSELEAVTFVEFDPTTLAGIAATEPRRYPDADRSEDKYQNIAILIFTSGTTGMPKPAIVSWAKCIVGGIFTSRFISNSTNDVFYTSMPLYHSSAAILGFGNTLEAGGTIAIGRKFSTKTFWSDVRTSGATIIQYVGETCRYLLAAPPQLDPTTGENLDKKHKVRAAFGNGLRPDVWSRFRDRFGVDTIGEFYAATEGTFGTWNLSRNDFAKGAIGRNGWIYNAVMGMNLAIVEVDHEQGAPWRDPKTGFCRSAGTNEPGELLCRVSPTDMSRRFQGYYGNPEATQKKVLRSVFRKDDAWFRTGDILKWDGEGRLFFSDRIGDTFRWKSENVSTQEVSEAIGSHPAVREANVYGVELPHHDGRAGCAALVLDEGRGIEAKPEDALLKSLAEHVKKALPKYALPLFLRVMPDMGMQMTGTNKQQKTGLRGEGVKPGAGDESLMYWLQGDTYVPFTAHDWQQLDGGRVKL
ncbi:Fatty acid transporter protein like [Verticillium longisporum]|uniref:Very long-chain fatty acid transport protein n=1 Tax=Verticillium longisporum TaxID=100787 RepID=A0A8I3A1B5_VERLO|nr:Fatty acid transporter protein like [Verticillium longisporum]